MEVTADRLLTELLVVVSWAMLQTKNSLDDDKSDLMKWIRKLPCFSNFGKTTYYPLNKDVGS